MIHFASVGQNCDQMFENLTPNGRTATEKGGIAILVQDKEKSQIFQQESAPKSVNFFQDGTRPVRCAVFWWDTGHFS